MRRSTAAKGWRGASSRPGLRPPERSSGIVPYGAGGADLESGIRLRLAASAAAKERRLAALLGGRAPDPAMADAVRTAQVAGSLGLAGIPVDDPAAVAGLRR